MRKIINKTPHQINIVDEERREIKTFEPVGEPIRFEVETKVIGEINNIPITKTTLGKIQNLPEPEEETYYIVSRLIASNFPEREDLLIPNETVRDENGKIVGCKSLAKI